MTKKKFLEMLLYELRYLEKEDRDDLINFYRERFERGYLEGKSEEDIVFELESPNIIAKNVYQELGVKPEYEKDSTKKVSMMSIVGVLVFDLLIASWLLITLYAVGVSFTVSILSIFSDLRLFGLVGFTDATLLFLALLSGYTLLFVVGLYILSLAVEFTKYTLIANIKAFAPYNNERLVYRIDKFNLFKFVEKVRITRKGLSIASFVAIVIMVVTAPFLFLNNGYISRVISREYKHSVNEEYVISLEDFENTGLDIDVQTNYLQVDLLVSTDDNIHVEHYYEAENKVTYSYDEVNKKLTITDGTQRGLFGSRFNSFLVPMPKVIVYIPEEVLVTEFRVTGEAASINIVKTSIDYLNINVEAGNIDVSHATIYDTLLVDVEAGNILVDNSSSSQIKLFAEAGNIKIRNSEVLVRTDIDVEAGNITVDGLDGLGIYIELGAGNLKLINVYTNTVLANVGVGNAEYRNSNTDFHPANIDIVVDIGNRDVDVTEE